MIATKTKISFDPRSHSISDYEAELMEIDYEPRIHAMTVTAPSYLLGRVTDIFYGHMADRYEAFNVLSVATAILNPHEVQSLVTFTIGNRLKKKEG